MENFIEEIIIQKTIKLRNTIDIKGWLFNDKTYQHITTEVQAPTNGT